MSYCARLFNRHQLQNPLVSIITNIFFLAMLSAFTVLMTAGFAVTGLLLLGEREPAETNSSASSSLLHSEIGFNDPTGIAFFIFSSLSCIFLLMTTFFCYLVKQQNPQPITLITPLTDAGSTIQP